MKSKIILWSVVSILTAGIARDADPVPAPGSPQVIQLDDHTKLTLLGTTFGDRHLPPGFEHWGLASWIYTAPDTTVVWIEAEHKTNQWPSFELLVSDSSNSACVNIEKGGDSTHVKAGVDIYGFSLNAYPRWDKQTILRVRPYQGSVSKEHFVITNPAPGAVDHWIPKPLPDTESDGNLEVTLTKLVAGAPTPSWAGGIREPTNDPANQCVHLNFDFRQNGQSTTNWQPWPVQTTDAAGNWSRSLIYAYPTNGVYRIWGRMMNGSNIPPPEHYGMDGYFYRRGLWPNEPWKVRLEFIQRFNFSDDEMVTFTNISVRKGNQQDADDQWTWDASNTNWTFIAQGNANGMNLKLLPPLLVPDQNSPGGQKYVSVIIGADANFNPKGMNLTVVSATDDQGRDISSPFGSPWAGHYSLSLPNVRDDIKSLNLKLALHKSRFVEFTVKPEKAAANSP